MLRIPVNITACTKVAACSHQRSIQIPTESRFQPRAFVPSTRSCETVASNGAATAGLDPAGLECTRSGAGPELLEDEGDENLRRMRDV